MLQVPKPKSSVENFIVNEQSKKSKLILLDKKQWSYVQNLYNLTPREREIAEQICQGLGNGGIARNLRIRPGTVKTHTRNIYRKVRVKNKIAMLLRFLADVRNFSTDYGQMQSFPTAE
ncbi:MAG: response regulator transcription factor [Sedimentisphaerales bacterium]|nr:response regulator transcription factor [Sedimentisphaerales bacterium]